jgi:hypothetical protein
MLFESEKIFEEYIRTLITKHILPKDKELIMFQNKKAVDVLLCRNGKKPALYFIEIKYHKRSHGRLSTGHGKGGGFQPEILSRLPVYFEKNMRWVLGVEDMEGYFLLQNSQLIKHIAGGAIGKKYNNIQMKLFKEELSLSEKQFITALKDWLQ